MFTTVVTGIEEKLLLDIFGMLVSEQVIFLNTKLITTLSGIERNDFFKYN